MLDVLALMALPVLCGIGWRIIRPGGLDADLTRQVLTTLVFNLLMPAMVLSVLWRSRIGLESLKIALFGVAVITFGLALTWSIAKVWRVERRRLGAAMLASTFPNVTFLGLPVLEQAFGPWVRSIVIQIDLFAVTPMVLIFGAIIGRHYGEDASSATHSVPRTLLQNPPLWAALAAVAFSLAELPMPGWLEPMLAKLSAAVIPLMLISLGLGLRWDSWRWHNAPLVGLVLALKLAALPWLGIALGRWLGFSGDTLTALVMEAGMPCMLMGVVYCDRYRLDTAFYTMAVAVSTLAAVFSLPFWRHSLG